MKSLIEMARSLQRTGIVKVNHKDKTITVLCETLQPLRFSGIGIKLWGYIDSMRKYSGYRLYSKSPYIRQ